MENSAREAACGHLYSGAVTTPGASVDAAIARAIERSTDAAAHVGDAGAELLQAVANATLGGKRLRATLTIESYHAHGGGDTTEIMPVAAALELFQAAALVHDDVLDDAETRRGRPTAHRALEQAHAARHAGPHAARFGVAGAILAGDLALVAAFRALDEVPRPVRELFGEMTELVTMGQYLDMRIAAAPIELLSDQEQDIKATMRAKTASYTAEFPLALGAAAAGKGPDAVAAARAAGVPAGIAFQLRDDLLGLVGDPRQTGKPVGGDIREGKRTVPLWHAWTRANDAGRAVIAAALGRADAAPETVAEAIEVIRASGAIEATEAQIARSAAEAAERIAHLDVPATAVASLTETLAGWSARTA